MELECTCTCGTGRRSLHMYHTLQGGPGQQPGIEDTAGFQNPPKRERERERERERGGGREGGREGGRGAGGEEGGEGEHEVRTRGREAEEWEEKKWRGET